MKSIKITNEEFEKIKNGKQTQLIVDDNSIENKEFIILECGNQKLNAEVTANAKYNSLEKCFKIIPIDLFGFSNISEGIEFYKNKTIINALRIKVDSEYIPDIENEDLKALINVNSIKKNNIGHSSVDVYEVLTKDGKEAILKIQRLSTRNDLHEEYVRIKWLQNRFRVPKLYYYDEINNVKYMLMEKIDGVPAHKYENFAYIIGKKLREFHDIDLKDCKFIQNSVEILEKNAIKNIDIIYPQIQEQYEMSKDEIINFIKNNVPKDIVLVHGDYSLPNILINESGEVGVIDLGDVSISSKYFDFYYLFKSLKRNKKIDKFDELLRGYGIEKLDENYMKWIEFVDKALF